MKIPQFKPFVGKEEYANISSCFEQNWITEGPKSKEFVENLLQLTGAKFGVLAPNGTLAIYLALISMGLQPGDEVIVPDFTFLGSASAVHMAGGVPVFCDVNRDNFQIDLESAKLIIGEKTKFIMPVHVYGTSCDMRPILEFASKYGLKIVEDAAQGIGVEYDGQHVGTFGQTGTFSFFADKTITTGEGGFIVTNDADVYENLLYLRNQGRKDRGSFIHPYIGYNFRMTDLQAAIGLVQLSKLPMIKQAKTSIWQQYQKELDDVSSIKFFKPNEKANFIPFRVAILSDRSELIQNKLKENDIETRSFFYPLRRQPCFKDIKCVTKENYNSDYGYKNGICLPSFVGISSGEISHICEVIKKSL
ncbi:DegT/DnrJ/EryC1/StrS family aminotransferase [Rhodobacteraceae bacterium nBUS_24]